MAVKKNNNQNYKTLVFSVLFLVIVFGALITVLFLKINTQNQQISNLEITINNQKNELFVLNSEQNKMEELKSDLVKINSDIQYVKDNSLNAKDKIELVNQIKSIEKFNKIYSGYNFLRSNKLFLLKMKIDSGLPFMEELNSVSELKKKDEELKKFISSVKEYQQTGIKNSVRIINDFNSLKDDAIFSEKYLVDDSGSFWEKTIRRFTTMIKISKQVKDDSDSIENILFTIEEKLTKLDYEGSIASLETLQEKFPNAFKKMQSVYKDIVIRQKAEDGFFKTLTSKTKITK